jgi:SH3-like domain-containing protein
MRIRPSLILSFAFAAAAILALPGQAAAGGAADAGLSAEMSPAAVIGPSGLPVPRFVALKKDEVAARFGPGFDYPVAAIYRRRDLPLKVVAETRDDVWRRVEDRDGRTLWIHRSMLKNNDHAVVTGKEAVLRSEPSGDAPGRARLTPGVVAEVLSCEPGWCRLKAGDFKGWLPADLLWGVEAG